MENLVEPHPVGAHRVRVDVDLVFLHKAAYRGYLTDAVGRQQGIAHLPVLDATQLVQVPAARGSALFVAAFQRVPEYLPQGRGIWSQGRLDALGQQTGRQTIELFEDAGARPVEIDFFGKNHIDARKAKHRRAADRLDARHAQKRRGQRIGHLIFHVLRRATRPLAEDDLLVLADIWNRIYGDWIARQPLQLPRKGSDRKAPTHEAD